MSLLDVGQRFLCFFKRKDAIHHWPEGLGLLRPLERRSLIERIVGHTHPLGGRQGRLTVRPEAYSIYPTLVWRPSLESLSPFAPFHMLTVGDRRIFVRLDGRVFTSLQTHIPGI